MPTDSKPLEDLLNPHHPGGLFVVPNVLRDAIYKIVDQTLEGADDEAKSCRQHLYDQLLRFFNEYGYLPKAEDLMLERRDADPR